MEAWKTPAGVVVHVPSSILFPTDLPMKGGITESELCAYRIDCSFIYPDYLRSFSFLICSIFFSPLISFSVSIAVFLLACLSWFVPDPAFILPLRNLFCNLYHHTRFIVPVAVILIAILQKSYFLLLFYPLLLLVTLLVRWSIDFICVSRTNKRYSYPFTAIDWKAIRIAHFMYSPTTPYREFLSDTLASLRVDSSLHPF